MKSLRSGLHWVLAWGTVAGPAAIPAEMAAQSGRGQPRGGLGAWLAEARARPFHDSTLPGTADPTGRLAHGPGAGEAGALRLTLTPMSDSAVSELKVLAYALTAATLPLVPAMVAGGRSAWGEGDHYEQAAGMIGGTAAALVLTPVAAIAAGGRSSIRTFAGTVLGVVAGLPVMFFTSALLPAGEFWMVPIYSLTIATVTTIVASS